MLYPEEINFGYRKTSLLGGTVLEAIFEFERDNPQALFNIKHHILKEKLSKQPYSFPSCGSVFKNPQNTSAGKLIEEAGCKGWQNGSAKVSEKHANFFVNLGKATAKEVLELIDKVRNRVLNFHNIELELEVKLWNCTA